MFRLAEPLYLLLLLMIPLYLWLELVHRRKRRISLPFTRLATLVRISPRSHVLRHLYPILSSLLLVLIVIALAQPQWGRDSRDYRQKGVDIVLAVDCSGSMLAMDFAPDNRLRAAVNVAREFIQSRPNDRFALVAFSEYAITQSPLTFDHVAMQNQLEKLEVNIQASGTAIGMGLAKAVARLKTSTAKSKLIILITDGVNNSGEIDPIHAAEIAKSYGIRVYPVGVGTGGYVDFPVQHPFFGLQYQKVLIELDMETLNRIAVITGTRQAASAGNSAQFAEVMRQIDNLEKTEFQAKINYNWKPRFAIFIWAAVVLLMLILILRLFVLPILPD